MKIKKLEYRQQWVCVVNEIQYIRTEIHWNDKKENDITWHLNKDYVQGEVYLNEEELEELFNKAKEMESQQKVYSYDDLIEAFVMGRLGETIKKFNGKFKKK